MFAWVLDRLPGLEVVHVARSDWVFWMGGSVVEKGLAKVAKCFLDTQASLQGYYRGGAKRKGGGARVVCVLYERIHH